MTTFAVGDINEFLLKLKEKKLYREVKPVSFEIDFLSNDYLGVGKAASLSSYLADSLKSALKTGSTASRLISGDSELYHELENRIAKHHNAEAALVFNSGYLANLSFFSTLPQKGDLVLYDQYIHASIRDGIRLGNAKAIKFYHNDLADLERKLKTYKNCYVAVESVYSMDGDLAPLKELAGLCKHYSARLVVDEAHSVGVYGQNGEGLVVANDLANEVFATVYTYGKAFAYHGASIVSSNSVINYLVNKARPFIYTTAMSEVDVYLLLHAYEVVANASIQRQGLQSVIDHYVKVFDSTPLKFRAKQKANNSPVQTCLLPGNESIQKLANELNLHGIGVKAIKSPTVPNGEERLRISLHSFNRNEEIDTLLGLCVKYLET